MRRLLREASLLTATALRGLTQRRGPAIVTLVSVTTVVAVLVSLLAIREGTQIFTGSVARPELAVIVSRGANNAFQSVLTREAVADIEGAPGVRKTPDGKPYAYAFTLVPVDVVKKTGKRGTVYLVGYTAGTRIVDRELRIVEGRNYRPAVHELVVSDPIRKLYRGMDIGDHIVLRGTEWTVVGVFAGSNSIGDSLLRADADTVMSAFDRNTFQQVNVELDSPASFAKYKAALLADPAIAVDVRTAAQDFDDNFGVLDRLLKFIAVVIGTIMASGAICGALNSLYASIDSRRRELATLRAIGFSSGSIILSVLLESLLLALPGAFLGALIAWILFNDNMVTTGGLIFKLKVTPSLLWVSIALTIVIGLLGGSLPAMRASRVPVATALRAT